MQTKSIGGSRYFITFIDDHSRYCRCYFMRYKSQALEKLKEFKAEVEKESNHVIEALRADRGGEYTSEEFLTYLKENGIRKEFTAAHSPQQNGTAERFNRTLMEAAKSMLIHAKLPNLLWAEAVSTASYLRNRMVTTALQSKFTSYQLCFGKKPDLRHIRVFGCVVYSHVWEGNPKKLDKKAHKLWFIGYTETTKNYRFFDEEKRRCYVRHDLIFNENDYGGKEINNCESIEETNTEIDNEEMLIEREVEVQEENQELLDQEEQPTLPTAPSQQQITPAQDEEPTSQPPRRSERSRKLPVHYGHDDYANQACDQASKIVEPATIEEAFQSHNSKEWKEATDAEYASLLENDTWDLVQLPEGRTAIGSKWIFKIKYNGQGSIERFKGRLVAQGHTQKYGIDYEETFAPVAHYSSIRTILAYAVEKRMKIHQMDVITAFLNGDLNEDIYMEQPPGYVQEGKEKLVCKLKKSLYGLKQSPRCWNEKLTQHVKSLGFEESGADPCIFTRRKNQKVEIIAIYVDDLIAITETDEEMRRLKKSLTSTFKMKDLGELYYCLGINFYRTKDSLYMCQSQFIHRLLEKYGLSDTNTVATPMDSNVKLVEDDGYSKTVDSILYQSMVGSILHLARAK